MGKKSVVLVLGSGGREHAIVLALLKDRRVRCVFCATGNAGIAKIATCVKLDINDPIAVLRFVQDNGVSLTIVGPEGPLAAGVVNVLRDAGHLVVGPTKEAAMLETSKSFARKLMARVGVSQPKFVICTDEASARAAAVKFKFNVAVKADGLTAGKGVVVCNTEEEFETALKQIFIDKAFGVAGDIVLIEECLRGTELSVFYVCNQNGSFCFLGTAQDHKRAFGNNKGPNTGGMGAYSPTSLETQKLMGKIERKIIRPILAAMRSAGTPYTGILYAGLMIKGGEPKVIEFNARFGDPEAQVILPRLKSSFFQLMLGTAEGNLDKTVIKMSGDSAVIVVLVAEGYPKGCKNDVPIYLPSYSRADRPLIFHAGTAIKDGKLVTNGGRVIGIVGTGKNLKEAIARAYVGVDRGAWFEGCHYRKDIGRKGLRRKK